METKSKKIPKNKKSTSNLSKFFRLITLILSLLSQLEAKTLTTPNEKERNKNLDSFKYKYKCKECPENCLISTKLNTCDQCKNLNLYFNGQKCTKCKKDCRVCLPNGDCKECTYTTYMQSGSCYPCSEGCSKCSSLTECTYCLGGYYMSGKTCKRCQNGCLHCKNASSCFSIKQGFFLSELTGQSERCPENCYSCRVKNKCIQCKQGFYKKKDSSCISCSSFFPNCIRCDSYYKCQECRLYWYPDNENKVCKTCKSKYGNGCHDGCSERNCLCKDYDSNFLFGECTKSKANLYIDLFLIPLFISLLIFVCIGCFIGFSNLRIFQSRGIRLDYDYKAAKFRDNSLIGLNLSNYGDQDMDDGLDLK